MSHDHDQHHDPQTYYYEQLFTIAACGSLGMVIVLLYTQGVFIKTQMLTPFLATVALTGGIGLLVLVAIRAVALWTAVEEPHLQPVHTHAHDHDHNGCDHAHHHHEAGAAAHQHHHHEGCEHHHHHEHAVTPASAVTGVAETAPPVTKAAAAPHVHDHGHTHAHDHNHGHSHDHGHEHGWAPWRYVLLFLPVALYFLNVPNDGYSSDRAGIIDRRQVDDVTPLEGSKGVIEHDLGFSELERAARDPGLRESMDNWTGFLTGRFAADDDTYFTLIRYKINCCAADAVPIRVLTMVDYSKLDKQGVRYQKLNPHDFNNRWVRVKGQIRFLQRKGTNEFIPALILIPTDADPKGTNSLRQLIKVTEVTNPNAD
jgi:hypothetical protein